MRRVINLVLCFAISACGTRNYEERPVTDSRIRPILQGRTPILPQQGQIPRPVEEPVHVGYLWRGLSWMGVNDADLNSFKDGIRDGPGANSFQTLGSVITGSAVLGLVIRASGSWFLGRPVDVQSGHWFWQTAERAARGSGRGIVRGALLGGACYGLLVGVNPIPFDGLLGSEFDAFSAATALAAMSALSVGPYAQKIVEPGWGNPEKPFGRWLNQFPPAKAGADFIHDWTQGSPLGRGMRYKVAPGLIIVGIATGVGLLVYNSLDGEH